MDSLARTQRSILNACLYFSVMYAEASMADEARTQTAETTSFVHSVRESVHPVDVLSLFVVPTALLAVFSLPIETRKSLAFSYEAPTLFTAFTSSFVHLDAGHLLTNLGGYFLVVPLVYLLCVLSGRRGLFYVAFVTFVTVFPVVLSYLNLAIARAGLEIGFSGIVLAFLGFLPLALTGYLATHFSVEDPLDAAATLFFIGVALISVISVQSLETYGLAAAATLAAVLFILPRLDGRDRARPGVRAAVNAAGYFELAVVGVIVFLSLAAAAFPSDPVVALGTLNIYGHLLGYALGFIVVYTTVHVWNRRSDLADESAHTGVF